MLTVHSHSSSWGGDQSGIQLLPEHECLGIWQSAMYLGRVLQHSSGMVVGRVKFKTESMICLVSFAWPPVIYRPETTGPVQFSYKVSKGGKFSILIFIEYKRVHLYYKWIWVVEPENKLLQGKSPLFPTTSLVLTYSSVSLSHKIPPGIPSKLKKYSCELGFFILI